MAKTAPDAPPLHLKYPPHHGLACAMRAAQSLQWTQKLPTHKSSHLLSAMLGPGMPANKRSRCLVLLALLCWAVCGNAQEGSKSFVGWKGEVYNPEMLWNPAKALSMPADASQPWVEILSWSPRAFIYHNFLTEEECDHLQDAAAPSMKRSMVGRSDRPAARDARTSYGTFLHRNYDPTIISITDKVASWVGVPMSHQEDIQVLRYGPGQKYDMHKDVLGTIRNGHTEENPRISTVLLYLSDVESGGETTFPLSDKWANADAQEQKGPWSSCAANHVAVKPRKGDALLFFSVWPDGIFDSNSFHQGCPVIQGIKWTATVWVHAEPWREDDFINWDPASVDPDPGKCEDLDPQCSEWARTGNCESNSAFMTGEIGAATKLGRCRLSCNSCTVCAPGDDSCYLENRKKAGYLNVPEFIHKLPIRH